MEITLSDTIVSVKSNTWYSVSGCYYSRNFFLSKIKYYEKCGHIFSHISELNITFIRDLRNLTYDHYLIHPKPMVEWNFNKKLAKNLEFIKIFGNRSHPLFRQNQHDVGES